MYITKAKHQVKEIERLKTEISKMKSEQEKKQVCTKQNNDKKKKSEKMKKVGRWKRR